MAMLSGERVVLQPLAGNDHPLLRRWLADRELRKYAGCWRPSPRSGWRDPRRDETFLILLRGGDRPIGFCGLFGISFDEGTAELGIVLGERDCWGQGYGPEALRLLLDHAYRNRGLRQISLCVHATNSRALRAYEKVGFAVERRLTIGRWLFGRGVEMIVMSSVAPAEQKEIRR
ncbi:GNAT family N-acetyltransferase [Candidatus Bipolaricaulota bacterium]|nr:GNAT family N-acetyltransferase [Candidatus Bipolaricaulota bacterium]